MLLFVGMEAPLLGMLQEGNPLEPSDRTVNRKGLTAETITERNRRAVAGSEEGDDVSASDEERYSDIDQEDPLYSSHFPEDHLAVSTMSTQSRDPKRNSIDKLFFQKLANTQPQASQLDLNLTKRRQQTEKETTTARAQLAKSLLEKHSAALQELQSDTEDVLDQERVFQIITTLRATHQNAIEEITSDRNQLTEERKAPRGFLSSFYLPHDKFTERENEIHQKLVTLLQERVASYPLELEWLHSFSPKRNALLTQAALLSRTAETSPESEKLQQKTETAIDTIQTIAQPVIEHLCHSSINDVDHNKLNLLSDEQLLFINEVIDLVRKMQAFILGCHSSSYITMSKEQLAESEEDLEEKIKELDPTLADSFDSEAIEIDPKIRERYLAAQKLLENNKAEFSLMETASEGEMINAAAKSAITIQQAAQETEEARNLIKSEKKETRLENQKKLKKELEKMKELHCHLLNVTLSYREIQDEAWIEQQCGDLNTLYTQISEAIPSIVTKATDLGIPNSNQLSSQLTKILSPEEFHVDPLLCQPESPLEFLDTLKSLPAELHSKRIIGIRGKIALDDAIKTETPNRREWVSGIKSMELAICRLFSIQIMQEFRSTFSTKLREENSLKVKEAIKFLFNHNQQPKYHSSFFIDPKMSHEDFLELLSPSSPDSTTPSDKVIKIDQATLEFNPFSKKPLNLPQESLLQADLRQREAGFQYVREALKKAFPKEPLTTDQMEEVLLKFNERFKVTPEGTLLTLGEAHAFIENERGILQARSYWKKYIARYLDQNAITQILNGLYGGIGNHLSTAIIMILSYLYYLSLTHTLT